MSEVITYSRFWMRRDTPSNWASANPVLHDGEIGIALAPADSPSVALYFKIGDGITAWNDLPVCGPGALEPPGDDAIPYWNFATGQYRFLTLGANLTLVGDVLDSTGGSGGVTDGDYGDVVVTASGLTWTIDAKAVSLAKMADVATATVFYRKSGGTGAPEVQTLATLKTDLGLTGTNSGDQTSIVGITGTLAQFNAALTGADFATGGGTATGTNTGDQTSIVGITGTKAQFDTACTDGDFAYQSDLTNKVVGPAAATDNAVARFDSTTGKLIQDTSGATISDNFALTLAGASVSASEPTLNASQTWNSGATTFTGWKLNVTDTASATASMLFDLQVGGTSAFNILKAGNVRCATLGSTSAVVFGNTTNQNTGLFFTIATTLSICASGTHVANFDSSGLKMLAGQNIRIGNDVTFSGSATDRHYTVGGAGSAAGSATSHSVLTKTVTAIADNTATTVCTITIPNAAHSAMVRVTLVGKIGAGGAVGAGEATGTSSYDIAIARTAGVNAVGGISAVYGQTTAAVAGATTITVTGTLGAVGGGTTATNTIDIKVTIVKGGGASANHTCTLLARVINANANGVTIA